MIYPVKTIGTTVVTNHHSNIAPKLNGNGNINNHIPQPEKIISSSRRIPRLIRSANVDDHNNNLLNDITSYKNGINGSNASKECHLKLLGNPIDLQNGEMNGNATKSLRSRNCGILKSPNFRTRVTSGDE